MKYLFAVVCLFVSFSLFAQTKPGVKKPLPKKTVAKKPTLKGKKVITTTGKTMLSLQVIKDDATYFYDMVKGDILVYEITNGDKKYDLTITINNYNFSTGIDFTYETNTDPKIAGRITIAAKALQSGKKYVTNFYGGALKLSDALAVWMSYDNFNEISNRKTSIAMDNGASETYYRPEEDAVNPEIDFKGETAILDGFRLNNQQDGNGNKEIWVHNISSNPLILQLNMGWTMVLKAVK